VALSLPAALHNTPGSRMPTTILDCDLKLPVIVWQDGKVVEIPA